MIDSKFYCTIYKSVRSVSNLVQLRSVQYLFAGSPLEEVQTLSVHTK